MFIFHVCVRACIPGTYGGQKAMDLLELELQAIVSILMWVQGTELRLS